MPMKKCTYCGKEHPDEQLLACPIDGHALVEFTPIPTFAPASTLSRPHPIQVVVKDFEMSFGSMVVFMLKWAVAAVPALIILGAVGFAIFLLLNIVSRGLK